MGTSQQIVLARAGALRARAAELGAEAVIAVVAHAVTAGIDVRLPPPAALVRAWLLGDLPLPPGVSTPR